MAYANPSLFLALLLAAPALLSQPPSLPITQPAPASAQTTDADALKLLQEVTKKYAGAIRSHIEQTLEKRQSSEMFTMWNKETTSEYEAPGNHYRFGGRDDEGTGLVVSDGTTEWELHAARGEYIKRPAGTFGHPLPLNVSIFTVGPEEANAYNLRRLLGSLANSLTTAHWQPEDTLVIANQKIECWVVSFRYEDYKNYKPSPNASEMEQRVWIDRRRKLILKIEEVGNGNVGQVGDPQHTVITKTFPVVSLDEPIPDEAFTFTPPANAKLVDNFTDPMAKYQQPTVATRQTPPSPSPVGTAVPDLTLFAADGKPLDLRTLRGRPVLIDLWATWCGPCLLKMPVIDRIYRFGKPAGLLVVGLDQDKNPADALNYLKKNAYGWDDYSDSHNGQYLSAILHPGGLPTLVLIDADGKITYFHSGADDDSGLVAAVRKLGPPFAAAIDQAEK